MEPNIENSVQTEKKTEPSDVMTGDANNTNNIVHPSDATTHHKTTKILVIITLAVLGSSLIIAIAVHLINTVFNKDWTSRVETPANPIYMQDWNGCDNLSVDDMVKLTDKRDGELYVVGKQADGKCWMLENLSLDLTNQQVQSKMNSSTTNASDASLMYLINGGGSADDQFAEEGIADWSLSNSYDDYSRPLTYVNLKDTTIDTSTYVSFGVNERVGVYYNYCATSAGSYCYEEEVLKTELKETESEITEDICPTGWRLPTKNDFSEFLNLKSPHSDISYKNSTIVHKKLHTDEKIGSCEYRYDYDEEDYFEKNIKKFHVDSGTTRYWSSTKKNDSVFALDIGLYNHPSILNSPASNGFTIRCIHK